MGLDLDLNFLRIFESALKQVGGNIRNVCRAVSKYQVDSLGKPDWGILYETISQEHVERFSRANGQVTTRAVTKRGKTTSFP